MDGVIADFERGFVEASKTPKEFKVIPGSYSNLHPYPGAVEGVKDLIELGYYLFILTKIPSENPYAATEKMIWLQKHFPVLKDHIIVTPDKGCVGTVRDFLIDDHPEWANAHKFPGTNIKFGGDAVGPFGYASDWERVVNLFEKNKNVS